MLDHDVTASTPNRGSAVPHRRAHRVCAGLVTGATVELGPRSRASRALIGGPANLQRPGYLGRVLPGFGALVVDEHDDPVPDDRPGELVMRHREPDAFATGYSSR